MASFLDIPRPTKTYHTSSYGRISPLATKFEARDKTVLVTGGATGIGLSICNSFAQAGVKRIIITSRSPGPQTEAKKTIQGSFPDVEVLTLQASITDQSAMDDIMRTHGPIDVLVLCAAFIHVHVSSVDIPLSEYRETFNTNVVANLGIVLSYLKQPTPAAGEKTIVNVSSAAGHVSVPRTTGYGPSKTAFAQVLARLAMEHPAKTGVRMFNYHPGAIWTPAAARAGLQGHEYAWDDPKLPGDFAVWLAGPESTFLNGKFVWAHWDVDELMALSEKIEKEPDYLTFGLVQ